ncbi:hypothetical protein MTO96_031514 [Rhipicephalus appendiculatus]
MAKDIAKLKDEMKAELLKLKEEMKQEMKAFRDSLERDLRNEIRELKNEQRQMTESLDFAFSSIEEHRKKLDDVTARNKDLESENAALRAECKCLESRGRDLEARLVLTEQYSRKANLEIQGVLKEDNESVINIVSKIGSAISEPITAADIEACHRVPSRDNGKSNIIVQFKSRAKRDGILKKAKRARLTNKDVGLTSGNAIYVNEHLCPALKKLLAFAVKKKYEYKWKSVWSFNGKIYAKQTDDSPAVHVPSEHDIDKVFSGSSFATS